MNLQPGQRCRLRADERPGLAVAVGLLEVLLRLLVGRSSETQDDPAQALAGIHSLAQEVESPVHDRPIVEAKRGRIEEGPGRNLPSVEGNRVDDGLESPLLDLLLLDGHQVILGPEEEIDTRKAMPLGPDRPGRGPGPEGGPRDPR